MKRAESKRIIQAFFEQVLNERNSSVLGKFVSEDYVEDGPTHGQVAGLAGVRQHIETFFTAFSNTHYELEDTIAEGNKVVARWTLTGTHMGSFGELAPTGRNVKTTGIDIYYLAGGKIREHWHEFDMHGLIAQLKVDS